MTWSDYTSQIRAIINELGRRRLLIGEVPLKLRLVKNKGNIFTKAPHITFQDNAILEFSEEISVVSNHVRVDAYKYQYQFDKLDATLKWIIGLLIGLFSPLIVGILAIIIKIFIFGK